MHSLDAVTPSQQNRILGMSTLAFTVCFAVWTIFSIIGVQIKQGRAQIHGIDIAAADGPLIQ